MNFKLSSKAIPETKELSSALLVKISGGFTHQIPDNTEVNLYPYHDTPIRIPDPFNPGPIDKEEDFFYCPYI